MFYQDDRCLIKHVPGSDSILQITVISIDWVSSTVLCHSSYYNLYLASVCLSVNSSAISPMIGTKLDMADRGILTP